MVGSEDQTLTETGFPEAAGELEVPVVPALVVAWSAAEPERVGEVFLLPAGEGQRRILGRGGARPDDPLPRLIPHRQRPRQTVACVELADPKLSRVQLELLPEGEAVRLIRRGRAPLLVGDAEVDEGLVRPGDIVQIGRRLVLLATRRPTVLLPGPPDPPPFGAPDADGIVGESPAVWALRTELSFVAARAGHVLIRGESGTGKELAARAIARRCGRRLVARNAATFPEGLIDAELFGNIRDYPNPGMRARAGLVGEADGGVLFLDEIAELPELLQTHLLRLLDRDGEYTRLGESLPRRADLRLIAATHQPEARLRHDLAARLVLGVSLPGLEARRDDIPLLAAHLLRRICAEDPEIAARLGSPPHLQQAFVVALLRHRFTAHVRELERLLWRSLQEVPGPVVVQPPGWQPAGGPGEGELPSGPFTDPESLSAEEVQAVLDRCNGVQEQAWRELGLASRHVLRRLVQRYGLVLQRSPRR